MKLSALVLTRNEKEMIADCLKGLSIADEIVVLDENSEDPTVEIAKKFTSRIYKTSSGDFAKNRNLLKDYAKGEWLLYLDADERLTAGLKNEIGNAIKNGKFEAYYFPRKNIILGKWLRHGGWWPDYVPRLFKKNSLLSWYGKVHESPEVAGTFGYMKSPVDHFTARNLNSMLSKSIKWAKIEAELYSQAKYPKITIYKVLKTMLSHFFKIFVIKRGFLDGTVGLVETIYQALHEAIILVYLWEIQNEKVRK